MTIARNLSLLSPNLTTTGTVNNTGLTNSSITVNGTSVNLGGTVTTGTVTSVAGTGTVSGLTLTGTVSSTGNLTLGGTLAVAAGDFAAQTANQVLAAPSGVTGAPAFRALVALDIPGLDAAKITSGTIDAARLPSYVDDVVEAANLAGFPATGETGKIYVAIDTNKTYRWSGSVYVYITSGAVDSVAGKTGVVTLAKADVGLGNVDNTSDADKLISTATQTALNAKQDTLVSGTNIKTVNGTSVLGSGNIQIDGGVTSFNTRTGAVTLELGDVTTALGFTPLSNAISYLPLTGGTLTGDLVAGTSVRGLNNAAGAGTTLNILGSTGTGIAGATGGNGALQIIGGGGTSPWTLFTGFNTRRRGGILLQAGRAAGDAGATYFSGSTINILGSSSTNNGTTTGTGSQIQITAGQAVSPTGNNNGGSINLTGSSASGAGAVSISGGYGGASASSGGNAFLNAGGSLSGTAGSAGIGAGTSGGGAGGTAIVTAGNSTGVAGGNVSITSGTGTANGKIGFTIGALGEVVQIGPTGAIGLSGANYGDSGQVLTSGGASAAPTWTTVSGGGGSPATPTNLGTVYGYTNSANSNLSLGYSAGTNAQGSNSIAIGKESGTNNQGSNSIAIGTNAADNNQGSNSVAVGENAGRFSQIGRSVAIGAYSGLDSQGFGSIAIGYNSGSSSQNEGAIAIGNSSGAFSTTTGQGQGLNSIAIGNNAGNTLSLPYSQAAYSTVLNATGVEFSAENTGLYVKPIRTSVAAVGTQYKLLWDNTTGEISATPDTGGGVTPTNPNWYEYTIGTGAQVGIALPSGFDSSAVQIGGSKLWITTTNSSVIYQPQPSYAWSNVSPSGFFYSPSESTNLYHSPPFSEYTDPTALQNSYYPGIYTMLYISPLTDSGTQLYVLYSPQYPNTQYSVQSFSVGGFGINGSPIKGHSVLHIAGDVSSTSVYMIPPATGTIDKALYDSPTNTTVFFISHSPTQLASLQNGTPIIVFSNASVSGSLAFWYVY